MAELVGACEAAQWTNKQTKKSSDDLVDVSDDIYFMMLKILDEVRQVVRSLPMRKVKQSLLDKEVRNLAAAAFPELIQQSLQTHFVRTATSLLRLILKDNDKVIVEEALPKKAVGDNMKTVMVDSAGNNEDEDAHLFPLVNLS